MRAYLILALLLCQYNSATVSEKPSPETYNSEDHGSEWAVYGGGPESTHYSKLTQINRDTVKRLQVAWTFDSGDAFPSSENECNPIVVNGVLFATTPKLNVVALDAGTGKLLWRFDPNVGLRVMGKMRSRGVTYWSNGKDQRVFFAVRQYLYSLDAHTGKPVESFGISGRIDLRDDLGREPKNWVTMTSPGIVYKDLLIIGSSMGEMLPASPGDIRAYDVRTGKLRWTFHTIPHPGEFGYETWPRNAWTYSGAANDWTGLSLDVKRGWVFAATGSAASDFYGADRAGDDLFANSVIALKADTGERVWHFQAVRHDIWDRDLPAPPGLVTIIRSGQPVDAVAQTTKSGFVYLFDRDTGAPLFPVEDKTYPKSDLEGEVTADTQPLPTAPEPFARQKLTADMLTQRTPKAHDEALAQFRQIRSDGQFVPGSREGTIIFPGFDGDVSALVSQGAGRMPGFARLGDSALRAVVDYVYNGVDRSAKTAGPSPSDAKFVSDGYNRFLDADGYPAIQPPWGTLTTINMDTGKVAWKCPLGEYPELGAKGMTNTGTENYGGPIVTAGGLLFIAATNFDKKFRAFDKDTGKLLWETILPAAGNATPSTYEVNGRQFVVIVAGGGKSKGVPSSASIVAYALRK